MREAVAPAKIFKLNLLHKLYASCTINLLTVRNGDLVWILNIVNNIFRY